MMAAPGFDDVPVARSKNRNRSAKEKKVILIGCQEDCDCCPIPTSLESRAQLAVPSGEALHAETPTSKLVESAEIATQTNYYGCEFGTQTSNCDGKPVTAETCVQTMVHLESTMRDVIWMPSGFNPVSEEVDDLITEDDGDSVAEGPGVLDIDAVEVPDYDPEILPEMKRF